MGRVDVRSLEGAAPGYLAFPKERGGPGVLVLHAWWGLNEVFKGVCDRLASAGFVAFAPDLYHGATASTIEGAKGLMSKLREEDAREDIVKSIKALQGHPNVRGEGLGVIGFSIGADWGVLIAEEFPKYIAAVVLFYGTGEAKYPKVPASFLAHFSAKDPDEHAL